MLSKERPSTIDSYIHWVLIFAVAIIPLIIRAKVVVFAAPDFINNIADTGLKPDIFSYYKWVFLMICTSVALILFIAKIIAGHRIKNSYINIPLLITAVIILVSALSADYKSIAVKGMYNRFEGAITYLCYLLLFFIAANTTVNKQLLKRITIAIGIFVGVNVILSLSNFWGYDVVSSFIASNIVLPANLENLGKGVIMGTLSHPNYLSGIAGTCTVMFMYLSAISDSAKNKISCGLFSIISFALLLSSLSSSGFVSLALVLPVCLFFLLFLAKNKVKAFVTVGVIFVGFSLIFTLMNNHNERVSSETFKFFDNLYGAVQEQVSFEQRPFDLIKFAEASSMTALDEFDLPEPAFSSGTGRTYIWQKTLELMLQKPFVGYGFDTITYYFPQNDKYKISGIFSYNTLVDKPHNMYLGIGFGIGIIGLCSLLVLFVTHIFNTCINIVKKRSDIIFFPALFLFYITFLVQALFNDSVIGTSVIFWIVAGIGVSLNNQIKDRHVVNDTGKE
ncbi:O-antigen ligase family protein [Desulfotomaculum sp. 1211_IL3151]|uniref:O-antigen ligase family protein n=1 Tax=Desulfotomaculum sp. 1211_IL3151 TaxID=3084055 RepID=UPI002FD8D89A